MGRSRLTADQFWAKVDKTPGQGPTGECWPWRGYIGSRGYGISAIPGAPGENTTAHRVALMLSGVKLGPKQGGCHTCDWPPCCNPDHLFAGTAKDNSADMIAKGRSAVGERNGLAKLTADDVIAMRARHASGEHVGDIARDFDVSHVTASTAIHGKTWRHVPMPARLEVPA